ncbi:copper resistance protein NlpE N-terminal domain-containing protein [Acinetobacter equi]|uniref:Copper homeostasis protein CutF n=1 Tax=Acinetobacter equi TaxID=1324350 RepID=A0A0N9W2Z8_9GAMM|nr:copper resistance protein NlpE N-terminal domain-containing protein [Acinetobacter equi]ALH96137.1 hypothetical protein AOY20_11680 [Acinetobacter equi]
MKKQILIPLFASTVLFGCQESNTSKSVQELTQKDAISENKKLVQWVGHYEGTTPCLGCSSRCDECPGMAVSLELKEDLTYVLKRESLSQHNGIEHLQGTFIFKNKQQDKIELLNVKTRHQLFVDLKKRQLEIYQDESATPYAFSEDFLLIKARSIA